MNLGQKYLRILGVITLFFGVAYLIAPGGILTDAAGFGPLAPGGLTDVRATYGGLQLGMGAFLLWSAADESRVRIALVFVALAIGAVALSRALGLMLDGSMNPFHILGLLTEVTLTGYTLYVLKGVDSEAEADPQT